MLPTVCNTQATHPLLADPGVSQPERFLPAVDPTRIQIDDRGLPELLGFILRLSKRIAFYSTELATTTNQLITQPSSWLKFFEKSQPFLLASITQTDLTAIEQAYEKRLEELRNDPSVEGLQLWIAYSHTELIKLILAWHSRLQERDTLLKAKINILIINKLHEQLKAYVALLNGADRWYCTGRYSDDFIGLATSASVWGLEFPDLYATDESFRSVANPDAQIRSLVNRLDLIFRAFLRVGQQWMAWIPDAFAQSLVPLQQEYQQTHAPHLGLLFAFLELFNLFRNDLNSISQKHLEYFYQNVLRIKPLPAFPDSVYLILETARTIVTPYVVKKGTQLLAGKDSNSTDIRFETDDEIVVDKAQVQEVRTLYLNPVQVGEKTFVENVYMAPMANSLDGMKTPFPDPKAVQWPTLGRKESPLRLPGRDQPEPYPFARLGWIIASPVLLLNEGKRTVTITIDGTFDQTENTALAASASVNLQRVLANSKMIAEALNVSFSGKEDWVLLPPAIPETTITEQPAGLTITITVVLEDSMPPITFFDKDTWKSKDADHRPDAPAVRITLNPTVFIEETEPDADPDCSLQAPLPKLGKISLYHYLRGLRIIKTGIKVDVCGVKNLIVQNDENLQDVNSPIYPFGSRPKIGSNFYIGSKEVFLKNWNECWINIHWSNKPESLRAYYKGYEDQFSNPPISSNNFNEDKFKADIAFLENNNWSVLEEKPLFNTEDVVSFCSVPNPALLNRYRLTNPNPQFADSQEWKRPINQLDITTPSGFLRFTLEGQDFQHSRYSYVLARQMMALGKFPNVYLGPVYEGVTEKEAAGGVKLKELDLNIAFEAIRSTYPKFYPLSENERAILAINEPNENVQDHVNLITQRIEEALAQQPPVDLTIDAPIREAALGPTGAKALIDGAQKQLKEAYVALIDITGKKVVIPNEPYTPIIKGISVDYTAFTSSDHKNFEFMHLYPYDGTYKVESLQPGAMPTLLPTFMDEGTLYIGLSDLRPNGTLNLLFQLAEITADSELDKVDVQWSYLVDNSWKNLLPLTHILKDGTDGLTQSGIVKMVLPYDIPVGISDNAPDKVTTIMPANRYWLRASVGCNARATANTIGIHAQAVKATFVPAPANDTTRLANTLPAGSITKLLEADSSISTVQQPYPAFGGKPAEQHNNLYRRIGELLRHKGRAVELFDYERLALEAFPGLFRAKCISHTLGLPASQQINCPPSNPNLIVNNEAQVLCQNGPFRQDLEIAPGFVLLAVIPTVFQLETVDRYEPRVPVGVLNDIELFLKKRASPFVRLKAMNPRYERVKVGIKVRLYDGLDIPFYTEKLKEDIRLFLSPWVTGDLTRLAFGLSVRYTDLILFVEKLSYVDYITDLRLAHEDQAFTAVPQLDPQTARSILTAGTITVTIEKPACS